MNKDKITGFVLTILGIIIIILGTQVHDPQLENDVGPRLFPYISGGGLVACGIGTIIKSRTKKNEVFLEKSQWKRLLSIAFVIFMYGILQLILGFLISTPIIMYSAMRVMGQPREKYIQSIGMALGLTLAVYLLFEKFLHVMLPTGTIF